MLAVSISQSALIPVLGVIIGALITSIVGYRAAVYNVEQKNGSKQKVAVDVMVTSYDQVIDNKDDIIAQQTSEIVRLNGIIEVLTKKTKKVKN